MCRPHALILASTAIISVVLCQVQYGYPVGKHRDLFDMPEHKKISNEFQLINPAGIRFHKPLDVVTSFQCDPYNAANTATATVNTVPCTLPNVCPGYNILIDDCSDSCVGDQQYNLYNANLLVANGNRGCTSDSSSPYYECVSGSYTYTGTSCVDLVLQQGCYGSYACAGQFTITYQTGGTSEIYEFTNISPTVISNDEIVAVSYYSSNPTSRDWIAIYAPLDLDVITQTTPVKYGYCDESPDYLSSGNGTLFFNLTNFRTTLTAVYFTNSVSNPLYLNHSSTVITYTNINEPTSPRVTPTGDPDVFNFLWSSAYSTEPTLKWGLASGGPYDISYSATSETIEVASLCGSPSTTTGFRDLGLIHKAYFTGMKALASENIYYIFGDEATNDYSKEFKLHVPPLAGTQPKDRPTTVILFDDLGRGSTDNTFTWNEYVCFVLLVINNQCIKLTFFQKCNIRESQLFTPQWQSVH